MAGINRVLAFDFGTQHIGVAVGNLNTRTSQSLTTVSAKNGVPDWTELETLITQWRPVALVVGLPLDRQGEDTEMAARARDFADRLAGLSGLPVDFIDERLSSVEAEELIRSATPTGKRIKKGNARTSKDAVAAQLILQSYFEDN